MLKTRQYCITRENVSLHELIGLDAAVAQSSDANKIGVHGLIVDETKNTIVIDMNGEEKVLPKKEIVLSLSLGSETVLLDGRAIMFRPEDRTKKKWKARA